MAYADHANDINASDIGIRVINRGEFELTFPDTPIFSPGSGAGDTTTTYADLLNGTYTANDLQDDEHFTYVRGLATGRADLQVHFNFTEIIEYYSSNGLGSFEPSAVFDDVDFFLELGNHNIFGDDGINLGPGNVTAGDNYNITLYYNGSTLVSLIDGTVYENCGGGAVVVFASAGCLNPDSDTIEISNLSSLEGSGATNAQVAIGGDSGNLASVRIAQSGSPTASTPPSGGSGGQVPTADPSCESSILSLGWILCPVARFMINALDGMLGSDGLMSSILQFNSIDNDGGSRDALNRVWQGFRAVANVGFVIAFFIVVYSAASGGLLSAYDVKKLAPKLLFGAMAVQLSFFICVQLVDFFNAMGNGVAAIMLSPIAGGGVEALFNDSGGLGDFGGFLEGVVSFVVLLLIILGFLMSIGGIILMLVVFMMRNMALMVLTVISPLAFVAWILPNTEGLFRKWWGFYTQLLALFPITVAFLSAGRLISYVWASGDGFASEWIGLIALFLPYLLAPKLFSFAGQAVNGVVRGVQGAKDGLSKGTDRFGGRGIKDRLKTNATAAAASRFNERYRPRTNADGTNATRRGGVVGRVARSRAGQNTLGKAVASRSHLEDEDARAASELMKDTLSRERARAATAGSAEYQTAYTRAVQANQENGTGFNETELQSQASANAADQAEINVLTGALGRRNAQGQFEMNGATSEETKRAAAKRLVDVHSADYDAARTITDFLERANTGTASDQSLGEKVQQENIGGLLKDIPQAVRGVRGTSTQASGAVVTMKGGPSRDFAERAVARGDTESLGNMAARYAEAAQGSRRDDISEGNATQLLRGMMAANMHQDGADNHEEFVRFTEQFEIHETVDAQGAVQYNARLRPRENRGGGAPQQPPPAPDGNDNNDDWREPGAYL